ncbi:MAG: hypothetical protein OK455_05410 [Thaumarchaeota archaeon]|nr:hypothetical protein [Nitrososphaerota archaeon]
MKRIFGMTKPSDQRSTKNGIGRDDDDDGLGLEGAYVSTIKLNHADAMAAWSAAGVRIRTGLNL